MRPRSGNRLITSPGLDTECDIAIAGETAPARQAIAKPRNRLLAEHVGVDRTIFAKEFERTRSLIGAIDTLNTGTRRLMDFPSGDAPPEPFLPVGRLFDPPRPLDLRYILDSR